MIEDPSLWVEADRAADAPFVVHPRLPYWGPAQTGVEVAWAADDMPFVVHPRRPYWGPAQTGIVVAALPGEIRMAMLPHPASNRSLVEPYHDTQTTCVG